VFGFGNKLNSLEKLYQKKLKEAYELSHTNRRLSDEKTAEADQILKQIDEIKKTTATEQKK
jgi:hypothetical protein